MSSLRPLSTTFNHFRSLFHTWDTDLLHMMHSLVIFYTWWNNIWLVVALLLFSFAIFCKCIKTIRLPTYIVNRLKWTKLFVTKAVHLKYVHFRIRIWMEFIYFVLSTSHLRHECSLDGIVLRLDVFCIQYLESGCYIQAFKFNGLRVEFAIKDLKAEYCVKPRKHNVFCI